MQAKLLIGATALAAIAAAANATVVTDTFDGTTLNPMWTLQDSPGNYAAPGGGFTVGGGYGVFDNIYTEAYGNIKTPLDASGNARVDAVMRTNHAYTANWNMGVSIYFDNNNWAGLRIGTAGGQYGWVKNSVINGVAASQTSNVINTDLRFWFLIGGVELTDTEVRFWGSQIQPAADHYGETNIDPSMSLLSELTIPRPASFTGSAKAIIGKGYSYDPYGYTNPDLANNASGYNDPLNTYGYPAPEYIDFARITTEVPEPASLGLLVLSGAAALPRRRSWRLYVILMR